MGAAEFLLMEELALSDKNDRLVCSGEGLGFGASTYVPIGYQAVF